MPELVEEAGRFVVDFHAGMVKTVMRVKDADGLVSERVTHGCPIPIFKKWATAYGDAVAEIDAHLGRQGANVVGMDGLPLHAADSA